MTMMATAQRDATTMTMATDVDNNDDEGNNASLMTCYKVDNCIAMTAKMPAH